MGSFRVNASQHGANTVYMTPSVRYAAHPLYSRIYKTDGRYFHIVPRAVNKSLTLISKGETTQLSRQIPDRPHLPRIINYSGTDWRLDCGSRD